MSQGASESEPETDPSDVDRFEMPDTEPTIPNSSDVYRSDTSPDESGGILDRLRGLFSSPDPDPGRDLDREYITTRLPENYVHIGSVKVNGDVYLRSELTGELYEPHEVHDLLADLAAFDGVGAAEIDPFEEPESMDRLLSRE